MKMRELEIKVDPIEYVINRVNEHYLRERIITQVEYSAKLFGRNFGKIHLENFDLISFILTKLLNFTGLYKKGFQNFKNIQIIENDFFVNNLPSSFTGFRIAHLSDLHLDIHPGITDTIIKKIDNLNYDLCVLTGDYRFRTHGDYDQCLHYLSRLSPHLDCDFGVYAILGNHDFIEMVSFMEDMGINILLNEAQEISIEDESIWLLGVDDAHFYGVDNILDALKAAPPQATKILLSHTPELYKKASKHPIDILLAGHTHGGQICLPGRKALFTDANCPRKYSSGRWTHKLLQGYTSNGTGSSGVPVRFFCPPEIVIHTLKPDTN